MRRTPRRHRVPGSLPHGGISARLLLCVSAPLWFSFCGCSYASARLSDLGDIVRLEGHIGYGLQAHVNTGEIGHFGVGSSRQWSAGWIYGGAARNTSTEEHLIEDSLVNLEKEFGARFLRIHRNALVYTGAIKGIEKNPVGTWQISLKGYDKKLDVSRRHTAQVRRWARNRPMTA